MSESLHLMAQARRVIRYTLCALGVFLISWGVWFVGSPLWLVGPLYVGVLVLAWRNASFAWALFMFELIVGGLGHLFSGSFGNVLIPIRYVVFCGVGLAALRQVILLGWAGIRERIYEKRVILQVGSALLVVAMWGIVRGFMSGWSISAIAGIANAWVYWILVSASILWSFDWWKKWWREYWNVAAGGFLAVALLSYALLIIFSFGFDVVQGDVYRWVRQTGLGEITKMTPSYYRIFLYSQIYSVIAWSIAAIAWLRAAKGVWWAWVLALVSSVVLIISQSRSFWVGSFAAFIVACVVVVMSKKTKWRTIVVRIGMLLLAITTAVGIVGWTTEVLNPNFAGMRLGFDRLTGDDPAGISRIHLLGPLWEQVSSHMFFGAGFGAPVTYQTSDPRVLAVNPSGIHTVTSFEWGHLGNWLQLGFFAYLLFIATLFTLIIRAWKGSVFMQGVSVGAMAIAAVHVFTPYLDHPLGIGVFIALATLPSYGMLHISYEQGK